MNPVTCTLMLVGADAQNPKTPKSYTTLVLGHQSKGAWEAWERGFGFCCRKDGRKDAKVVCFVLHSFCQSILSLEVSWGCRVLLDLRAVLQVGSYPFDDPLDPTFRRCIQVSSNAHRH